MLSDKINIKDIMKALGAQDARAAIRWCKKRRLLVFKFGKEKYVNIIDFKLAVDKPFIDSLKIKYPQNWKELYEAYRNGDYITVAGLTSEVAPIPKTKFVVEGKAANDFMKKMKLRIKKNL